MTPEIREEWNRHQSNFARTWRRTMVAKKKIEYRSDLPANDELWNKIAAIASSDQARDVMLKDFRLIEAALATDRTVISLDDKVRTLFKGAAVRVGELRTVVWVNPALPEEQPIDWLNNGANPERDRLLSSLCDGTK